MTAEEFDALKRTLSPADAFLIEERAAIMQEANNWPPEKANDMALQDFNRTRQRKAG